MKTLIFPAVVIICCIHLSFGQSPPGINYQGVARDMEGKPLALKNISIKISIVKGSAQGDVEFAEEHAVKTNSFGLFTLVIGTGDAVVGNFNFISWAIGDKWMQVEMDPEGGYAYYLMGSQQFMSVPYAFYAKYSGNGLAAGQGISIENSTVTNTGDADNNPSNELNTSATLGTDRKLRITDGGGTKEVDLTPLTANPNLGSVLTQGNQAGGQRITNLGAPVAGTDAVTKDYADTRTDGDASATNEIQDLQLTGNDLKVTNNTGATTINLSPYLDNTDQQTLTLTGSSLQISNGNTVDLGVVNTDGQALTLTGTTLAISGGNSVNLATLDTDSQSLALSSSGTDRTIDIGNGTGITLSVADNDNNSTNEIQDLSLIANELRVTNNATSTAIDLAPYLDNTDAQGLTFNAITNTLGISGNGSTVNLTGYLDNTDAQQLSTGNVNTNTRSLTITGGNTTNIDVQDADASITNEIQDLTLIANELRVTNNATATGIDLTPYLDNTDGQGLTFNAATNVLGISGNASTVDLSTYLDNTDSQTLSKAGAVVSLTGGGSITLNDDNAMNELQDLTLNTGTHALATTNSPTATSVSLAPYMDNTDAQTLTYTPASRNLSIVGGNTVNIPETQDLNQVLTQGTNAGAQKITNLGAPTAPLDAANKQYVDAADAVLSSAIATTYAFKTAFAFTNGTPLAVNDAAIPFTTEAFDDFNVLAGSQFTAMQSGTYVIIVDGGYNALLAGATLSVSLNGTKYPVALVQPWGGTGARFNASMMFKLNPGDIISLVGDNVLVGGAFTGSLSGYKL